MKRIFILSGLMVSFATAGEGFHQHELPGYADTPMIPNTEFRVHDKNRPQPPRVVPGDAVTAAAPEDAIALFDGGSLDAFRPSEWKVSDGVLTATHNSLVTKQAFGDFQMHVEWRTPEEPAKKPGDMGNSGLYIMGLYELQVFDSYMCKIYADGSAAAIYGQTPPMANASRKSGEWQSYDIVFTAPRFEGGKLVKEAFITVIHNGVLVHNHTKILGPTGHRRFQEYTPHAARLPIHFQAHGSPVQYRNIWIRELE